MPLCWEVLREYRRHDRPRARVRVLFLVPKGLPLLVPGFGVDEDRGLPRPMVGMTAAHHAAVTSEIATHRRRPSAKALHACTGCGRCTEFCKHHNAVGSALFAARGDAIARGLQPAGAASTLATFAQSQNPFGQQLGPLVARWRADAPVRYPLFPGCTALVKRSELIEQTLKVADAFGAPMGVSRASWRGAAVIPSTRRERSSCSRRMRVRSLPPSSRTPSSWCRTLRARSCSRSCTRGSTWSWKARVRTVFEVLDENLPHAPVHPPLEETVAYHDACHLGRGLEASSSRVARRLLIARRSVATAGRRRSRTPPRRAVPGAAVCFRARCPTLQSTSRAARPSSSVKAMRASSRRARRRGACSSG